MAFTHLTAAVVFARGAPTLVGTVQNVRLELRDTIMGDKSPKSAQKRAGQKQVKADEVKRKKKAASDAKRAVVPKK
jgi:hypothetical protein